jgi:hypothetical protein
LERSYRRSELLYYSRQGTPGDRRESFDSTLNPTHNSRQPPQGHGCELGSKRRQKGKPNRIAKPVIGDLTHRLRIFRILRFVELAIRNLVQVSS